MRQELQRLMVDSTGKGLIDITSRISAFVANTGISDGLLTIWCSHTSASLTVQENASPAVRRDVARFFEALVPEQARQYEHADEGEDDMPAHLRTMLTHTSLSVPVIAGQLTLGTWQAIYLFEHRRAPHKRDIVLHLLGA